MIFISKCEQLQGAFGDDRLLRENGTLLLGPGKMPAAMHYFYAGASDEHIKSCLLDCYANRVPNEYIEFLQYSNGATLFNIQVCTNQRISFALPMLTIYGLPWHAPYSRKSDQEEPADIAMGDLCRHADVPNDWLKFASYQVLTDIQNEPNDLFVDTKNGKVYSCVRKQAMVNATWLDIDRCLCELFDSLSKVDLKAPVVYLAPDPFLIQARGEFYGGPQVDDYIEDLLTAFPETMGKTKRLKAAKQLLKEAFHTDGKRFPYWLQEPEWPMGANSPMAYESTRKDGNRRIFIFRDVDTGEICEIEQSY